MDLELLMPLPYPEERGSLLPIAMVSSAAASKQRENLLAAAARASHLLLEATDVMTIMPDVLRLLGEAAEVDRTAIALTEICPEDGQRYLSIKCEWLAPGVPPCITCNDERKLDCFGPLLQTGQSVHVCAGKRSEGKVSITSDIAQSAMIVPFRIDGEYAGAVGFDDRDGNRKFDPAVVSALEIAASVIGAALHRQRLLETVRREREAATEQRAAELAWRNATLRSNLEQLASEADVRQFLCRLLLDATRLVNAAGGSVAVALPNDEWRVMAHVRGGELAEPEFPATTSSNAVKWLAYKSREPMYVEVARFSTLQWPGLIEYHRSAGHRSLYYLPLLFGEQTVGFMSLAFRHVEPVDAEHSELLVAIALQATLAIGLKRLGFSAERAAVLAERNRIGQEIHDGLAQAFTGILMQLGATEEMNMEAPLELVLTRIRDIAREGLQEARRSVLALKPGEEQRPGGLELALRQLAERSNVADRLVCYFNGGATPTGLAPEHEHELLRIAQEALSNAVRHAHPRTICIALTREDQALQLSITDDGRGMEDVPEACAQQGFGMTNMRKRAQAIGGEWRIESTIDKGTRVSVRIPRRAAA
jgi:signal transduction histidine kinase